MEESGGIQKLYDLSGAVEESGCRRRKSPLLVVLFIAVRYRNEFTFHVPGFFYFILLRELNSWEEETFSVVDDTVSCSYVMQAIIYKREVS